MVLFCVIIFEILDSKSYKNLNIEDSIKKKQLNIETEKSEQT